MTSLVRDSLLLDRARAFLAAGPADARSLIAYVCELPGAPAAVAEHMAAALFEREREFARDADGRWGLAHAPPARGILLPPVPAAAHEGPRGARRDPRAIAPAPSPVPGPVRPLETLSYVVVDVETTGTRPWHGDRVTEVAAVTVRAGAVVDVWETLVNPERSIPPFITSLTQITWDMVKDAPPFRGVAARLSSLLEGHLFVAHNATFDWGFLSAELERATGQRLAGDRLCTVRLARALLPQLRRRSLDSLAHYFGIENSARHRAAGDAIATAHVLLRLLREAEGRGCVTLEDVLALSQTAPRGRRRRAGVPRWGDGGPPA